MDNINSNIKTNMEVQEINKMVDATNDSRWSNLFIKGDSYKNYSTLIVIATRGNKKASKKCECGKEVCIDFQPGFHPWVVEGWKRLVKPMNVPIVELVISGHEVGEAYEEAITQLLTNPQLKQFNYVLFLEDDMLIPYMPDSFGPLIEMFKHLEKYDVASGLYWTKGEPSLPLIYGDGNIDSSAPFAVNIDWKPGDVVNVNGCGMGFTLMKRSIFEDERISRPFFKSVNEIGPQGPVSYTQDLFFYEKIKKLGYTICVDTGIRIGHLDVATDIVY